LEKVKEGGHLGVVDEMIIVIYILRNWSRKGLGAADSEQCLSFGSCERGNKQSGFIKGGKFVDPWNYYWF
jgi:hypothetical protein